MSMLSIVVGDGETHEYAAGTTAGEVIHNVHGPVSYTHLTLPTILLV